MSRTQLRFESDQAFTDGQLAIPGADFVAVVGATTYAKIAFGEYSLHCAASATAYTVIAGINSAVFRTGMQDNLQEQFGSNRAGGAQGLAVGQPVTYLNGGITAGQNVNVTVQSTVGILANSYVLVDTVASGVQEYVRVVSITSGTVFVAASIANTHASGAPVAANVFTSPASATGTPPFTGLTQLTPLTAPRPKGIKITSLTISYLVGTANISAQTIGLAAATYANGVAPVITTLIANATNNLPVAFGATTYAWVIPVPVAQQVWLNTFNTVVAVEFDFTTGTSGTVDVLGATLGCSFNFA